MTARPPCPVCGHAVPLNADGSALAAHTDPNTARACAGARSILPAGDLLAADFERATPPAGNLPASGFPVAAQVDLFALDLFNLED